MPEIVQYRFCPLVFGLTSSPAILNGTIQYHLSHYKRLDLQVAELSAKLLYVGDFTGGVRDDENAFHLYQKGKRIMQEGGFNLRKWNTNSHVLNQRIGKEDEQEEHETEVKILGLNWDTVNDAFGFDSAEVTEYVKSLPPAKRSVLKGSAKLFAPLGLGSPLTENLKMLFQKLSADKAKWDLHLEGEMLKILKQLPCEFGALSKSAIPRCYFMKKRRPVCDQLHGFSGASENAIAAAVHMSTAYQDGDNEVRVVESKTKVSPLKKQSIPRLEVLGACMLCKLLDTIHVAVESLPLKVDTSC